VNKVTVIVIVVKLGYVRIGAIATGNGTGTGKQ
jgi:hypothetical protein